MKIRRSFLFAIVLLSTSFLSARNISPLPLKAAGNIEGSRDNITMFTISAGFLAGGKQNTCYMLRSRIYIAKFSLDGTMYQHFHSDRLYTANLAIGNFIQFSVGAEFGDRTFYINKDSTLERYKFKNTATGEYEPYSSFPEFTLPQEMICYNMGIAFGGRFKFTNYWRGVGQCWGYVHCKWELMFAPKIGYDNTVEVKVQGPYQATTDTYEMEGPKPRKFGFRLMFDSRMGSKIGWVMEVGMRPGMRSELNEEYRFSNGYLRMGVSFTLSAGGRRELEKPGFGKAIPDNR